MTNNDIKALKRTMAILRGRFLKAFARLDELNNSEANPFDGGDGGDAWHAAHRAAFKEGDETSRALDLLAELAGEEVGYFLYFMRGEDCAFPAMMEEVRTDGACDTCGGYWCHPSGIACWNPNTGPQPNEPVDTEEV